MKPALAYLLFVVLSLATVCDRPALAASYTFTTIDVPGASITGLSGINTAGQAVGFFFDGKLHGFLRDTNGNFTTIDVPGALSTIANGINDAGQIVGGFGTEGIFQSFLYNAGTFMTIPSLAYGINDAGQIVGRFFTAIGFPVGFLYTAGTLAPIGVPGAGFTQAFGINNAGQIVGVFGDSSLRPLDVHGFLATPISETIPEPSTLLLLGSGILVIIIRKIVFTK